MQNTENFDLKIYEGEDLFNPLVVENANAQAIDNQMKKNENHTVGDATELVSGTVHALTRLTPDTPMLRFTATSRFTAGDTFTVDGVQVSALTVSGEQLPDGAYIIGSEVLAYLKGTLLTFFTSQGTLATAQNALKLGGNAPEYYATASAVETAQNTATAAGNIANNVSQSLSKIGIVKEYQNLNTTLDGMTDPMVFNQFTVSEDGLYEVIANLYGTKLSPSRTVIGVQKNGFTVNTEHNGDGSYGVEASRIFECSAGDVINGVFYNSVSQSSSTNNLVCQIIRLK